MSTMFVLIRKWHRDIGYFFVGLTISFSVSGIFLNHRRNLPFDAGKYVYFSKEFQTNSNTTKKEDINDELIEKILSDQQIDVKYMGFRIETPKLLNIFLEGGITAVDMDNGYAKCEIKRTRPIIGHMLLLHTSSNSY